MPNVDQTNVARNLWAVPTVASEDMSSSGVESGSGEEAVENGGSVLQAFESLADQGPEAVEGHGGEVGQTALDVQADSRNTVSQSNWCARQGQRPPTGRRGSRVNNCTRGQNSPAPKGFRFNGVDYFEG